MLQLPFDLQKMPDWTLWQEKLSCFLGLAPKASSGTRRVNQGHLLNPQFPSEGQKLLPPPPTPLLRLCTNLLNLKEVRDYSLESIILLQNCMKKGPNEADLEPGDLGLSPAF